MAALLGHQKRFAKQSCFLCLWDDRYCGSQYRKDDWKDVNSMPECTRLLQAPLVPHENFLVPPFHVKSALIRSFIKADIDLLPIFVGLHNEFPCFKETKLKEGMFSF